MRLGQANKLLLPSGEGVVRAPSGARIPYRCEPGELIELSAPEWATVSNGELVIDLCELGLGSEAVGVFIPNRDTDFEPSQLSANLLVWQIGEEPVKVYIKGKLVLECERNTGCAR
jgi:hypothetical protein